MCIRDSKEAAAGDLVAITKLGAVTGDTLCDPKRQVVFDKMEFPEPCYSLAVKTAANGDESKVSSGIHPVSYTHLDVYKRQASQCAAVRAKHD